MGSRNRAKAPQDTYASAPWESQYMEKSHMNETSNNTAANETATNETTDDGNLTALMDTVEESGMLDALMDGPNFSSFSCIGISIRCICSLYSTAQ